MRSTVLVVDDEPLQREILRDILEAAGYETLTAGSGTEALAMIARQSPDVILTDLKMKGMSGIALLEAIPREPVPPAVILVTAHGTIASAVEAVRLGALDYLTKPLEKEQLLLAVRKGCERTDILKENWLLRQQLFDRFRFEGIVGRSPRMATVLEMLKKVAATSAKVMIRGESGTGKELVARAIHYNSSRRSRPFTALNCATIPENLFESELFGHEAGAFTGATSRQEGLFEVANGGTLFLDEVGDLPMSMQSKLLRVLQDREIRRVGGKETIRIDVRLLSATNKDLEREMENGAFREDLYYRLNVVFIELPALRERAEDIPILAGHFLEKYNAEFGRRVREIRPEAMQALLAYRWPGNVRQLESVIERAVLLGGGDTLTVEDIVGFLSPRRGAGPFELPEEGLDFEQLEKELMQKALTRAGGVATKAARLLRMNYKAFLYRMEKFGLKGEPGDSVA
ncbi:MAG: sigma-54-dependent Fis family transcriptional regulator [Desulfuromonadales bacterium]|nr:sigma-54-dependent Fis family transcriptional regulator [Desulfuromonadales bacterium]